MYVPKPPWCWRKSSSILKDRRPAHANSRCASEGHPGSPET
jgi:hypothetical protein